jgi:hypothetical protein
MEELIRIMAEALRAKGYEVDEGTDALGVDFEGHHYDVNIAEVE